MKDSDERTLGSDPVEQQSQTVDEGRMNTGVDQQGTGLGPRYGGHEGGGDGYDAIHEIGPLFIHYLFSAAKTVQVHDLNNRATTRVLLDLLEQLHKLAEVEGVVTLRVSADYIHLNDVRLTIDSQNFGPFMYVLEEVRERDIEIIEFHPEVAIEEMGRFLQIFFGDMPDDDVFGQIETRIADASITHIKITQWVERERHLQDHSEEQRNIRKDSTKVFFRTVLLMGEVLKGMEQKRVIKVRKAERLTQQMVDIIQADESILVGLTSIKNFDEYTFAHSVNVCVLSMLMADHLKLYKSDTARLGVAALFHDIGKTYVPQSILNNPSKLEGRDWDLMKYHTFFGVKELSRVKTLREVVDALFVSLQHHVHFNGNGYPQKPAGWNLRLFTRIVTVADYYDAMTSPRIYKMDPVTPDRALRFILHKSGEIFDPFVAKVFLRAMGVYPIGTVVELDTGEICMVVKQNESSRFMHRPFVTPLLYDGTFSPNVEPFDLAEPHPDGTGFRRTIARALHDPTVEQKKTEFFTSE
ncbi:MAG: HD-GYP domain-containing protein [Candidatus Latescibacterota bacterium]|nr:MAG: HD-GYP domain-containing protein [Candidatus Latescibacterota bacterium]